MTNTRRRHCFRLEKNQLPRTPLWNERKIWVPVQESCFPSWESVCHETYAFGVGPGIEPRFFWRNTWYYGEWGKRWQDFLKDVLAHLPAEYTRIIRWGEILGSFWIFLYFHHEVFGRVCLFDSWENLVRRDTTFRSHWKNSQRLNREIRGPSMSSIIA